jgi:glutathione S-transferase
MTSLRLFGTTTSPYVRRVRAVALELGQSMELVNTFTPEGQAELRSLNPLWKVPTLQRGETVLFDSHVIIDDLIEQHGPGPFEADLRPSAVRTNVLTVIDGVLDALINTLYLRRDGLKPESASYFQKQLDRAAASMTWLEQQVDAGGLAGSEPFGLPHLWLVSLVEWAQFRDTYPVDRHPSLLACVAAHAERDSLKQTRPVA